MIPCRLTIDVHVFPESLYNPTRTQVIIRVNDQVFEDTVLLSDLFTTAQFDMMWNLAVERLHRSMREHLQQSGL